MPRIVISIVGYPRFSAVSSDFDPLPLIVNMSLSSQKEARNAALRQALSSAEAANAASIPDEKLVPEQCKDLKLPWQVEEIPDSEGAKLHWIGDRSATNVLLYFHGGGFGLPAFPGHIQYLASCMEKAATAGNKLLVAFLEYGLTPVTKYPTQYLQAVQALRYVIATGYPPSRIVVGGDSAGGNMVLGLLSSISHSHPAIPALELSTKLRGALLMSPWVSFSKDWESYRGNADRDLVAETGMLEWADAFAGPEERNNFSEPIKANADWWKTVPVENTLLVWGEYEVFRDSIAEVAETLVKAGISIKTVECSQQVHVESVLDSQSGMEHGPMSKEIWDWLTSVY
ncbi:Alpha/Beta hydrolase protein [Paraphoma chrysanthemicola]|uniref:Alpha/Beta hydrolase protein n=1 Tax=Paraphoma chrysanthemicola TaxID=798071 RepID=A0A8K0R2D1_9PLEO|nr:Alpha/Beta hydrolase protein [Paraphoma chrysanthemicola]